MIYGHRPGIHYMKRPLNSGHAHFREKILYAARHSPYKAAYQIWSFQHKQFWRYVRSYADNCRGHVTHATPTFRENYLCARSAFPIQSRVSNLKSLAQVVFEILRYTRIGVTSLTFQGQKNRSRDHSIAHMPFSIGSPLEPNLYL